jgi:hypothetical protein
MKTGEYYKNIIENLKHEIEIGTINKDDNIVITRAADPLFLDYQPIVNWYYENEIDINNGNHNVAMTASAALTEMQVMTKVMEI